MAKGKAELVLAAMASVNSYFQLSTPTPNADWTGGVYMAGNLAHLRASQNTSLLTFGLRWGDAHGWQPAG